MAKELIKAIVVEDQPVIWEYAKSCMEGVCDIKAFCTTTAEAEAAFREHKPDLVWLDCYLGEISEIGQGVKNSGIMLAKWIKQHSPKTKVFLFSASNEANVVELAKKIEVEGIALGGKYIKDKSIIVKGLKQVLAGKDWMSPELIAEIEIESLAKITMLEFYVICSMILGKPSSQIADELDTTRKRVNNAIYRIREKLGIDDDIEREELLEICKERIKDCFKPNDYYQLSDIISLNSMMQATLNPMLEQLKEGKLERVTFSKANL